MTDQNGGPEGAPVLFVDKNPLQTPGQHKKVRHSRFGGPESGRDARMYLTTKMLQKLLEVAESSVVGQVQLDTVGLDITLYETPNGHRYEAWKLLGGKISPVTPGFLRGLQK